MSCRLVSSFERGIEGRGFSGANMVHHAAQHEENIVGVSSPTFLKKSFAAILGKDMDKESVLQGKQVMNFRGDPAVFLNEHEMQALCAPLKFALIGSFTHVRPTMKQLKEFFVVRGFKGSVEIGLLNQRQILIRPLLEEDYIRI